MVIRGYECEDLAALVTLWNAALPLDTIDERILQCKVILDPNFRPEWLRVAEVDGKLVGLCLCLIRRVPLEGIGLEEQRAWVSAFAVHPDWRRRGIGSALLDDALGLCAAAGRTEVVLSCYTPNYFAPGVDVLNYAEGLAFLEKRGFEVVSRPLSMDANIVLFDWAPYAERQRRLQADGVDVRVMKAHEAPALLEFLREHMHGDWVRHAREVLVDATRGLATSDQFVIAVREGEVVGYCQFEDEHFGPFGVRDDLQGKGIGTVLLALCLQVMRNRGLHNAWVLWTSDDAAERVYSRFGFRETRRFAIVRRRLKPADTTG